MLENKEGEEGKALNVNRMEREEKFIIEINHLTHIVRLLFV